jgi:hypothetical protein
LCFYLTIYKINLIKNCREMINIPDSCSMFGLPVKNQWWQSTSISIYMFLVVAKHQYIFFYLINIPNLYTLILLANTKHFIHFIVKIWYELLSHANELCSSLLSVFFFCFFLLYRCICLFSELNFWTLWMKSLSAKQI